jgi:4-amino-4-deoxy-L-arabinose transferase-like glycosyltransferase
MLGTRNRIGASTENRSYGFLAGVGFILLAAAAFRFLNLASASVWMDEAFTVLASRLPVSTIIFDAIDTHPPLAYVIQHFWITLFPDHSLMRIPAAFVGTATVIVVIASTADLHSRRAALWAGLFIALATGHIYYSQDARMYPFVVLGLAVASWGLIGAAEKNEQSWLIYSGVYLLGAVSAIYSHVIGLVFLAAINIPVFVMLLVQGQRRRLARWLGTNLLIFVFALPYLLQAATVAKYFGGLGVERADPWVVAFFIRNAVAFAGLPRAVELPILLLLIGLSLGGAIAAWRANKRALSLVSLSGLYLFPAMILLLNIVTPILATRVFLPMVLPLATLFGVMMQVSRTYGWAWAAGAAVIACASWASVAEHYGRTKPDDSRAALEWAVKAGYRGAPVVTCHFMEAVAPYLEVERMGWKTPWIIFDHHGALLRFDGNFFQILSLSMARFVSLSAREVDAHLGGGYLYSGGLREAVGESKRVIVISSQCGRSFVEELTANLAALGYVRRDAKSFVKEGRVVFERGKTQVLLFER